MEFIKSTNSGSSAFFSRFPGLGGLVGEPRKTAPASLPLEIQRACQRLGVPLTLFAGLMRQSTEDGFYLAARTAESSDRPKNFPFQSHHLPIDSASRR